MAMLPESLNTGDLPKGNEPLPEGWYTVQITATAVKPTKAGNGTMLTVDYTVTGPTMQGRRVFGSFNIRNPNPETQKIALQQLGDLCRAVGFTGVLADSDDLLNRVCEIHVRTSKPKDNFDPRSEAKGWRAVSGAAVPAPAPRPAAPRPAATAAPKPATPGAKAPAWAKPKAAPAPVPPVVETPVDDDDPGPEDAPVGGDDE
jgi:hypothetical protein